MKLQRRTNGILQLFPNPVYSIASVGINAIIDETVQLRIADNTGLIVMIRNLIVKKGLNNFNFDLNSLSAGIYFIKVTSAYLNEKIKLINNKTLLNRNLWNFHGKGFDLVILVKHQLCKTH